MNKAQESQPSQIKKYLLILLLVLAVSLVMFRLLLTFVIHSEIEKHASVALQREVKLEDFSLGLFNLDAKVEGFSIEEGLTFSLFDIDIRWSKIFSKKIVIEEVILSGLALEVIKEKQELVVKGLEGITNEPKKNSKDFSAELPIEVEVENLTLKDTTIILPGSAILNIEKLKISNISLSKANPLPLKYSLLAKLNEGKIRLEGEAKNFQVLPLNLGTITSHIQLERLDTGNLSAFVSHIGGVISLDMNVDYSESLVKGNGKIKLDDFFMFSIGPGQESKVVNYYVRELVIEGIEFFKNKEEVRFSLKKLLSDNLTFSIPKNIFEKRRPNSKFAKVRLNDLKVNKNNNESYGPGKILLQVDGVLNRSGKISVKDFYQKNSEKRDLIVKAKGLDLTPFSLTFENLMGYQVESGKVDVDLKTSTVGNEIEGEATVLLDQFDLDSQSEDRGESEGRSAIPLDMAISLISDKEGKIETQTDISGKKNNPDFGFLPMLKEGVGSVLISNLSTMIATKAATKFVPMLLSSVPVSPGALFTLVKGGYDFATKPRFQDIQFEVRKASLTQEPKDLLTKIGIFLNKSADLRFRFCPIASTKEGPKMKALTKEQTLTLASKRIDALKKLFGKYKVPLDQAVFCRPNVSDKTLERGVIEVYL